MGQFLRAIEAGVTATLNDPAAAWGHFIAGRPQLDDELNKRAFTDTLPRLAHVTAAADPARYEAFSRYMKDQGLIATARPAADYLVRPPG
jgi:putative hydroxymethylpyrimidine transport system substrate-binding protein